MRPPPAPDPARPQDARRLRAALGAFVVLTGGAAFGGEGPDNGRAPSESRAPTDFKIKVALYGPRKEPVARAEVVVRRGVAYRFVTELPRDVLIIDPTTARVRLLDLPRRVQTELTSARLDGNLTRLRARLGAVVAARDKIGTRAGRVIAEMTRDLVEPKLQEHAGPDARSVRLTNPTVEVDAAGEPEADPARLALVFNALAASLKVDALRDPDDLPPFVMLDALRALARRRLRPVGVRCVYRLAGPPRVVRWSYALVPDLTDREVEAIDRIDGLRRSAPLIPYDLFEIEDDTEPAEAPRPRR